MWTEMALCLIWQHRSYFRRTYKEHVPPAIVTEYDRSPSVDARCRTMTYLLLLLHPILHSHPTVHSIVVSWKRPDTIGTSASSRLAGQRFMSSFCERDLSDSWPG